MHVFVATSTEPSNAIKILFLVPLVLESHATHGARNEMMSRQSKTRALTKFTAYWGFDMVYIFVDNGKQEVLKMLFMAYY